MTQEFDAVVVGSGPNGLTAAASLASVGKRVLVLEFANEIGGGTRTAPLTVDGFVHDVCASVHPFGAASPAFRALSLSDYGLEWCQPPLALAHPLDDGRAVVLDRDGPRTQDALGADARRWQRRIGWMERSFDELVDTAMGPHARIPPALVRSGRFALQALRPATKFASAFDTQGGAALFAGLAAHSAVPLDRLQTSGPALLLAAAARTVGWPSARGGSASIAAALAAVIHEHGGEITTGYRVRTASDIPPATVVLLDISPRQLVNIYGSELPAKYRLNLLKFRHGPGVVKLDYALREPIPWTAIDCREAGTVHLGGTLFDIAAAEAVVASGQIAEQPFVICGQSTLADPSRAPTGQHTMWAYCHVPQGIDIDVVRDEVVQSIERQIERFAPGFRDVVLERSTLTPSWLEAHNPNLHGGDFAGGSMSGRQLLLRPRPAIDPYRTPLAGVYLGSASTPPGPGVHGMCGWNAAQSALRRSFAA